MRAVTSSAAFVSVAPTTPLSMACAELSSPRPNVLTALAMVKYATPPRTTRGTMPTTSICRVSFERIVVALFR